MVETLTTEAVATKPDFASANRGLLEQTFPYTKMLDGSRKVRNASEVAHRDYQERILENMAELDPIGHVIREVQIEEVWAKKKGKGKVGEAEIRKMARGHFFEMFAIGYLYEIDEPPHPEISAVLLDVVREPKRMIEELESMLGQEGVEVPEELQGLARQFEHDKKRLTKDFGSHQRNNDAIALRTEIDEETGELAVLVTGTYEMKSYYLLGSNSEDNVREQLKESRKATVKTIKRLGKYIPLYLALNGYDEIPTMVGVVSENEFRQTLVQPDGMFAKGDPWAKEDYEKRWPDCNFLYTPATKEELGVMYEAFEEEVLEALGKKPV